ncbi:MAG: ATPase, T2SS/T4P/T4SS family [Candidatus Omnitrophota bacterium]
MSLDNQKKDSKKKMLLGEYLLEKGLITKQDLDSALEKQQATGQLLGQILIQKHLINEVQLYQILAELLGVEFLDMTGILIPEDVIALVPEDIAETYNTVPIKKEKDVLTITMIDPRNTFAIDELRMITGFIIKPMLSTKTQIRLAIEKYYGKKDIVEKDIIEEVLKVVQKAGEQETVEYTKTKDIEKIRQSAEDTPIVKLVNAFLTDSVKNRASDIHIEPSRAGCKVRFRVDGILHDIVTLSMQFYPPVVSRIKIMGRMDIAEKRLPQDGSFQIELEKKHVDIRVSTYPTMHGEKVVMRLLVKEEALVSLNQLGFEEDELLVFESLIQRPCGIFLVVGPTGSGKTTALYVALTQINSRDINIITVEDPVEYEIEGISQSQVNVRAGFTFANSLRSIMRQDPDVILVGEIRDLETAQMAVRAALTGHMVFSTLHTNDAPGAITRLMDMGIEPYLISSSLVGILAQRLVRVVCSRCREKTMPPQSILDKFKYEMELSKDITPNFQRAKGCENCKNTGYKGRVGIYELLPILGDEMRACITTGFRRATLRKIAEKTGMRTLKANGFRKALRGITTVEEVLRVTELV